ncbi:uncharacterized protein K452DRAFT_233499 [Aplosporella prunicola CBS 121167]|uniref:Gfo/Idh/MocA-like oxidoreductase N-terminal domain-containing protein n=1 Tax=Aplosporella prunicola CBS 121167 TaxID=1176127 RepID=A0A6A6B3N4_9PEZI|nr:uncharacterized protein K452DRAFT_233499 [Aplosporella prunicola CBS 121167]KAF2138819.1 hypothetical protein K452DRAFT_233499 [Aplosporella prunicola CBS 121167]
MSVGVAIIGSGIFAREQHLPAVQAAPSLTLKALYSRSLASAQALSTNLTNVDLYSDDAGAGKAYKDLLARDDIKGVIIALPIPAQPEYIKAALSAGKHVLSEKPIAQDMATARSLLQWYDEHVDKAKATWGVAENYRYIDSFLYGAEKVRELGRVLGFSTKVHLMVQPGAKYYETSWRKTPTHQGGFLLDGGVHFIAGTRLLLPTTTPPVALTAFSTQLQAHLSPVDTIDSIWKLSNGSSGTFSASFGTTFAGSEYRVACERGSVTVGRGFVVVQPTGMAEIRRDFPDEGSGVKQEVRAWAEKIESAQELDERQCPVEALRDLEILEAMLRSGENAGKSVELEA